MPAKGSAERVARPVARLDASLQKPPGKMKRKVFERELEKLHADGKAVALHRLAVSHPGRGTKFSGTRNEIEPVIGLPAPRTDHACSAFADIFRKSSFCARLLPVAFKVHANFHRDAALGAVEGMDLTANIDH